MRRAAIGLLGLYWLALFVGTHMPFSLRGMGHGSDKILHMGAFTGLAFLMGLGIGGRRPTWRTFALVLASAVLYGGFDELSQLLVGRQCEFWDWVADLCGAVLGLFAYWLATMVYQAWSFGADPPETEVAAP